MKLNFSSSGPGSLGFDPNVNYYQKLGLTDKATDIEIKKAFYSLAKKYHPDSHQDAKLAASNEERFKEASNAYEVLSDSKRRETYDELRRASSSQFTGGYKMDSEYSYGYDSQGNRRDGGPRSHSQQSNHESNKYNQYYNNQKSSYYQQYEDPFTN